MKPDMSHITTDQLIQVYQSYRDNANGIAVELESRGLIGEYQRGGTGEWNPFNPSTRPTQFRFREP